SMTIGQVIKHLNQAPGGPGLVAPMPYPGEIWAKPDAAEIATRSKIMQTADLEGPAVEFNPWEYALKPLSDYEFSGWFPRGRLTVISGSSGSMKTTAMAQALIAGREREKFLGHQGGGLNFAFVFADRGKWDAEETFKRMKVVGQVPYECINGQASAAVATIKRLAQSGKYQIVFVDGGDLLVADNN